MPIAALTGHAAAGDRDACLAAGMDDYVAKPTTFDALKSAMRRWRGGRLKGAPAGLGR